MIRIDARLEDADWPKRTFDKIAKFATAEFNPNQERDEHGRWTDGDAGFLPDSAPRVFDDEDDENPEWRAILSHDKFLDDLDEAVKYGADKDSQLMVDALERYRGDGYQTINAKLRQDPDLIDKLERRVMKDMDDEVDLDAGDREEMISRRGAMMNDPYYVSELINSAPKLKEPITVYRGVKHAPELDNVRVGDQIVLNGFQSTTFDPATTSKYLSAGGGGHVLEMRVDHGLALGHAHSIEGEMEFLLDHGDAYRVMGIKTVPMMRYEPNVDKRELRPTKVIQLAATSVLRRKK